MGPRLTQKLQTMNIDTAWQLATANPALLRKKYSVVLERTARELNGVCCLALEDITLPKQQIVCSRSFGQQITAFNTLRSAVCEYMARAAEKLRAQRQLTKHITIFIQTSRFQMENHYANSACTRLSKPTDDTRVLIKKATLLLQAIWKDGYCYNKAGVVLADFFDPTAQQGDFFEPSEKMKSTSLMAVVDTINASTGKLFLAAQGVKSAHTMHQSHRSPAYTTNWKSLPTVR